MSESHDPVSPWRSSLVAFQKATVKTREHLARDRRRARHHHVRQLLDFIARHLFEPELRVAWMKEACGIRDNSSVLRFRAEMGLPPSAYVRHLRMETSSRLLVESGLRIGQIGALVGYPEHSTFNRAFRRWAGVSPRHYRERTRQAPEDPEGERWARRLTRLLEEVPPSRRQGLLDHASVLVSGEGARGHASKPTQPGAWP